MKAGIITNIIDKHLKRFEELGGNRLPQEIEPEMLSAEPAEEDDDEDEEWQTWISIPAKVSDDEIREFEELIGHRLPEDYKTFLQHKHFYELIIDQASFCPHPVNTWRADQSEKIFNGYPRELLIDRGFIPIADWSDWGLLCFDTTLNSADFNYPVVLWDHENFEAVEDMYADFYEMMVKLDEATGKKNTDE